MGETTVIHVRDMQPNDVYIGRAMPRRGLRASMWANPFKVGQDGDREQVINLYRRYLANAPGLLASLPKLDGKRLACWCRPERCHGDVLVELLADRRASTPATGREGE